MDHLREVANAEILDAEPKLFQLIERALNAFLMTAIARQEAWLESAMTLERETVAAEGIKLAPLGRARDRLKADLGKLVEGIASLEHENTGLSAAAASAVTSAA